MLSKLKPPKIAEVLLLAQVIIIWVYLFNNIASIGDFGNSLVVLAVFFLMGLISLLFQMYTKKIYIAKYFVGFMLFIIWVCIRFLIDYQDYMVLREYIIGTTGGIVLFFMIGLFVSQALNSDAIRLKVIFFPISLLYFTMMVWLYVKMTDRMLDNIFLVDDPDGAYQRPGNFMSISYIIYSLLYCKYIIEICNVQLRNFHLAFLTLAYFLLGIIMLVLSQLIGSNSAFAVILINTVSSLIFYLIITNAGLKTLFEKIYKSGCIKYKSIAKQIFMSISKLVLFSILIFVPSLLYFEIDITQTRIFGFGNFDSTSFGSRADIFRNWGVDQMTYAPVFGNAKVAYYITGDPGASLHNFIPSALSSLGLVGVTLILYIFYSIVKASFVDLNMHISDFRDRLYIKNLLIIYKCISFLLLFILANITVDYSWIVLWFAMGMYFNAIRFKKILK